VYKRQGSKDIRGYIKYFFKLNNYSVEHVKRINQQVSSDGP